MIQEQDDLERPMQHVSLDRMAEDMVAWLSLAVAKGSGHHEVSSSYFTGAFPMSDEWVSATHSDKEGILPTDEFSALRADLDISLIRRQHVNMVGRGLSPAEWALHRVRVIEAHKFKPILRDVRYYGKSLVEVTAASIHANKRMFSARTFWEKRGGIWQACQSSGHYSRTMEPKARKADQLQQLQVIYISAGLQLLHEYKWIVQIGWTGKPSISFDTDPVGAREVFRLRDIPEGASRRAALLHWVREHWRQNRKSEKDDVHVRAHLRGATKFVWSGLECSIRPSAYEVEKLSQ